MALVAERWYVALIAESCRMEFPVGFLNAPNFFFQEQSLPVTVCISVLPLCNLKSNYHNPHGIPRLSLNFASCTRYFFVLYDAFVPVTLVHFIHTRRIPLPYT